jgi:DNA-binding NarL/FixJ family response regulator
MDVTAEAGDIPAAQKLVAELQPDIAIVDVMLPEISGLEGTPLLKAIDPDLKVILVSAYHDRAQIFQTSATEVGAEAFIPKDELDLTTVRSWIEQANHRRVENEGGDDV